MSGSAPLQFHPSPDVYLAPQFAVHARMAGVVGVASEVPRIQRIFEAARLAGAITPADVSKTAFVLRWAGLGARDPSFEDAAPEAPYVPASTLAGPPNEALEAVETREHIAGTHLEFAEVAVRSFLLPNLAGRLAAGLFTRDPRFRQLNDIPAILELGHAGKWAVVAGAALRQGDALRLMRSRPEFPERV